MSQATLTRGVDVAQPATLLFMDFTDLEQLHGVDLARQVMREVYERDAEPPPPTHDHGGLPINGTWAFRTLQLARERYSIAAVGGRLPEFKSGTVSYNMQIAYFGDGTEIRTNHADQYEAQCAQAIVLLRLAKT